MNTTEFIKKIDSSNILQLVATFFDEIMVLYNLIGDRRDINISADIDESLSITFDIVMETKDDALQLYDALNGSNFEVYDISFNISMNLMDNIISTHINKE